jgi:hypothetical protein
MKPIQATDTHKPMSTLQACLDELNARGALGTLRWSDGFAIPVGVVVRVALAPVEGADGHFAFVYAVMHFDQGGEHHGGVHMHHIVNWAAEDPPFLFEVIDDDGSTLTFELLEPTVDRDECAEYAAWRAKMDADPAYRDRHYGDIDAAARSMAANYAARLKE